MSRARFWLRWSLRDLRERWLLVIAIALTIALGTGAFAGMSSTTQWRLDGINASLELLRFHDLRLRLVEGSAVPAGSLRAVLADLRDPAVVAASSERLVVPVSVDASDADSTILVPGLLVGVELAGDGPAVDRVLPDAGRGLAAADDGMDRALIEYRFARFHELPGSGRIRVGGREIAYVGQATTPEMLVVTTGTGAVFADASYAGVFAGLATAQRVAGMDGLVNDLVLRVAPGTDIAAVAADLRLAAGAALPGVGLEVLDREDEAAFVMLTRDVEGDRQFFTLFAVLVLAGAAFAAFNLTSRIVESQRRQLGIGMALGLPDRWLALRPVLVGAEIAFAGVVLGVLVGLAVDAAMLGVLEQFFPLPVFEAPLLPGPFLVAAATGFLVPFAATLIPVRRAIRMPPVEAIHAGPRAVRGAGLAGLASRLPLPAGTFARAPIRNILRAPRRSLLTALGIGSAIGVLVAMAGMLDTFGATIRQGEQATVGDRPDRVTVELAGFIPEPAIEATLAGEPAVGRATPGIRVAGVVAGGGTSLDVLLELVDPAGGGWVPRLVEGRLPDGSGPGSGGILLAREAARDLGVTIGDEVRLRHPRRTGETTVEIVETVVRVTGTHTNPLRSTAYLDKADADLLGLAGMANVVDVTPAAGATEDDLVRALFGKPGVVSVQPVAIVARIYTDLIEQFSEVFLLVEGIALLMALLVAFNSASIATEERAREHATMLAFGVPLGRVLGIEVVESVILGLLGTVVGLGIGAGALFWFVEVEFPNVMPDLGISVELSATTVAASLAVGVLVVGLAPLLMARRLRRMDLPGTLRLVE